MPMYYFIVMFNVTDNTYLGAVSIRILCLCTKDELERAEADWSRPKQKEVDWRVLKDGDRSKLHQNGTDQS